MECLSIKENKMKMKKLLAVLLVMCVPSMVLAGATRDLPVTINFDAKLAQGNMVTARFAKNKIELIGCGSFSNASGFVVGFCQARDSSDAFIICFTEDPVLVDAIRAHADFSFIRFTWNDDGQCMSIRNSTISFYIPNFQ